ncbi:MAG TPA: nuclease-related domain-containing protein [Acidimicrobiales bacterium]
MTRDDTPHRSGPGTPGASARARYEALRARDDARRRRVFGRLAPVVSLVVGPKRSTEAWGRGAEGEERVGPFLTHSVGDNGIVLHDRKIPRSRANLDHLAVVASGIWVIDSKHYRGRLQLRTVGGWFAPRRALCIGRFEHSALVRSAERQRATVVRRVPPDVPVNAALCFTGVELGLFARPFVLDGVLVAWPKPLAKALDAPGPLDAGRRHELAALLARAFPPYGA